MDSLFSPNASTVDSPCPNSLNVSLASTSRAEPEVGASSLVDGESSAARLEASNGGRCGKDAPAKRTRQNFSLKDKPLEASFACRSET